MLRLGILRLDKPNGIETCMGTIMAKDSFLEGVVSSPDGSMFGVACHDVLRHNFKP